MITVRHILSNGQEVESVAGRVVMREEVPAVYALINQINQEAKKEERKNA